MPIKPKVAKRKKTTTLKCAVVGKPTPTVKWFRADEEIIPDEKHKLSFIPETNEHVLTIIETDNLDESIYTVQAVNKFGRAECRANIVLSKYSSFEEYSFSGKPCTGVSSRVLSITFHD